MEDQRSPEYAAAYEQAMKTNQEESVRRIMKLAEDTLRRTRDAISKDNANTKVDTDFLGVNTYIGELQKEPEVTMSDEEVKAYWKSRRPVNAMNPDEGPYENIKLLTKSIAMGLVFTSIPSKEDKFEYENAITVFKYRLDGNMKRINPKVVGVDITKHETFEEPTGQSGDRFYIEIKYESGKTENVVLRLTTSNQFIIKTLAEDKKRKDDTAFLDNLFSSYLNQEHVFTEDLEPKKFDTKILYESIVEKIDEVYAPPENMSNTAFYQNQIDLLIKKLKTLETDETADNQTRRNNATLLKYFICKYLKRVYSDKYNPID